MVDLNRVYTNLAARGRQPQVDIQSHAKVADGIFKVIAATFDVENESEFANVFAEMTDGKGRMIPGSFNRKGRICVAMVAANAQSKPMDASFSLLTASTALASDGTIWSVVNDGGNKRVVLESCDDLGELLKLRQASRAVHANPVEGAGLDVASFQNGDLVRFVDVASKETSFGLAFRTDAGITVAKEGFTTTVIPAMAIVATVPKAKLEPETAAAVSPMLATAKLDPSKLDAVLSYLKKAYPKGPMADALFSKYRKLAGEAR